METPEQFRDRIGKRVYDARLHYAGSWEVRSQSTKGDYIDAALAVYTQALRDVLGVIDGWAATTHIQEAIKKFAAERGIDLTESEDA